MDVIAHQFFPGSSGGFQVFIQPDLQIDVDQIVVGSHLFMAVADRPRARRGFDEDDGGRPRQPFEPDDHALQITDGIFVGETAVVNSVFDQHEIRLQGDNVAPDPENAQMAAGSADSRVEDTDPGFRERFLQPGVDPGPAALGDRASERDRRDGFSRGRPGEKGAQVVAGVSGSGLEKGENGKKEQQKKTHMIDSFTVILQHCETVSSERSDQPGNAPETSSAFLPEMDKARPVSSGAHRPLQLTPHLRHLRLLHR